MLYEDVNYDYFQYVVQIKEPERICFGSGNERKMIIGCPVMQGKCGPQTYNITYPPKPRSKRGIAGISDLAKRKFFTVNSISPSPQKYAVVPPRQFTQNYVPFNNSGTASRSFRIKLGPGPTVYNPHKVKMCKRTRFDYNFGKPCIVPCVEMVCINYPTEKCAKCDKWFEFGDHWHKNYVTYLCTFCMHEEHRLHEMFTEDELLTFKKIRTCAFMHRHESTSAAIRLIDQKTLDKKIRKENYLSVYMQCYGTKSKTELKVPYNDVM